MALWDRMDVQRAFDGDAHSDAQKERERVCVSKEQKKRWASNTISFGNIEVNIYYIALFLSQSIEPMSTYVYNFPTSHVL